MFGQLNFFNKKLIRRFFQLILIIFITLFIKFNLPLKITWQSNRKTHNILNLEQFHYIIQNEICVEEVYMLILVHSAPNHFHHRNLIRSTWGSPELKTINIKVVFLLAVSNQYQNDIFDENELHHDIIQGSFIDSYRNLTYKHVMGLKWAFKHCSEAKYLLKMDDDIFVDIYKFMDYIKENFSEYKLRKSIACFLQSGMPVVRDPVSKWYVSKSEYPSDIFENYCSGWAYLTTIKTANLLYQTVKTLEYFWVDDVHVTGTAAKKANVSHIRLNAIYDLESDGLIDWSNNPENLRWNKIFAPTWGDFVLSRKAYIKSLKCYVIKCKCCYIRKTTPKPSPSSTTRKGVAELLTF